MHPAIYLLQESPIVKDLVVLEETLETNLVHIKIKVGLIDDSLLFIRESYTPTFRKYAYHWQDKKGKLICRWDNAPHYPKIKIHPFHKHEQGKVKESNVVSLKELLQEIEKSAKAR